MRTTDFVMETLAHFIKCDDSPPPGVPAHFDGDFEQELISICSANAIAPIIYKSLSSSSSRRLISHLTWERLRNLSEESERRSLEYISLCEKISSRFERARIEHHFVLGAAHAMTVYPSPGLRSLQRIELLLKEDDIRHAEEVLNAIDFTFPLSTPVFRNAKEAFDYFQYFSPCVFYDKRGLELRIRFRLVDLGPSSMAWPARRGTGVKEQTPSIPVPCAVDQLIMSALELNISGFTDLPSLVDVGLILTREAGALDWWTVFEKLEGEGFAGCFYMTIDEATRTLKIPSPRMPVQGPSEWRRKLFALTWHPFEPGGFYGGVKSHPIRFHFLERSKWRDKIKILKQILRPEPRWVSAFFGRPCSVWRRMEFTALALAGKLRSDRRSMHPSAAGELDGAGRRAR